MQTTGFKSSASMKFGDRLFGTLAKSFAWLTLSLLAGIILALIYASWPSIQAFGIGFLFSDAWNPPMDEFGALIPIYGTIVTSVIALLIAVPVSFGIALFLTEMAPAWLRRPLGTAIELLAAIPSIVYGMWGLLVFAPIFAKYIQPGLQSSLGQVPVIGNTNFLDSASLFAPGNSITSALANEFAEADPGLHTAALMELGLILFMITLVVLVVSKLLLMRLARGEGTKT